MQRKVSMFDPGNPEHFPLRVKENGTTFFAPFLISGAKNRGNEQKILMFSGKRLTFCVCAENGEPKQGAREDVMESERPCLYIKQGEHFLSARNGTVKDIRQKDNRNGREYVLLLERLDERRYYVLVKGAGLSLISRAR